MKIDKSKEWLVYIVAGVLLIGLPSSVNAATDNTIIKLLFAFLSLLGIILFFVGIITGLRKK